MNPDNWNLPAYVNAGNYVPAMSIEFITCAVSMLLVVNSVVKYRAKRNRTTLEIIFVFCGIFISAFLTALGKLLVITETFTYPFVVYNLFLDAFAIMTVMISNTAFFLFTMDVFYDFKMERKRAFALIYVAIEGAVAAAGLAILLSKTNDKLLSNILHGVIFSLSLYTYLLLTVKAFKVAKKATGFDRQSMKMIGLSGVVIIAFFFLFALDVLNLFGLGNISLFYFAAWTTAIIGIFVTHVGYFRPAWFKRIILGRGGEENKSI